MNELKLKNYKKAYDYVVNNRYSTIHNVPNSSLSKNKELRMGKKSYARDLTFIIFYSLFVVTFLAMLHTNVFENDLNFTLLILFLSCQSVLSFVVSKKEKKCNLFKLSLFVIANILLIIVYVKNQMITTEIEDLSQLMLLFSPLIVPFYALYKRIELFLGDRQLMASSKRLMLSFKKNIHLNKAMEDLEKMKKDLDEDTDFKQFLLNYNPKKEEKEVCAHLLSLICNENRTDKKRLISYLKIKTNKESIMNT